MVTLSEFKTACPSNKEPEEWVRVLNDVFPSYGIVTLKDEYMFLAQTGHESSDYTRLVENLNYSAKGLLTTFPKYFKSTSEANAYARQPQKIANRVYNGRMGNKGPNDGWTYRGFGIIQATGHDNHAAFGKTKGMSALEARKYMESSKKGMVEFACWFWQVNGISKHANALDIERCTRIINGGLNGLADRRKRLNRLLNTSSIKSEVIHKTMYLIGDKGDMVRKIQAKVGVKADGDFGAKTKVAVKAYQKKFGLTADGIVGPATLKHMGLN